MKDAMTVRELIEELETFDPDSPVFFSYNYGDHCRTTVAGAVRNADEETLRWSEYHRMHAVVDPDDEEPDHRSGEVDAVVLSTCRL